MGRELQQKRVSLGQRRRQIGVKHLESDDDLRHEEVGPQLRDVGQRGHADHQVGRADVRRAVVLNEFVEHLQDVTVVNNWCCHLPILHKKPRLHG